MKDTLSGEVVLIVKALIRRGIWQDFSLVTSAEESANKAGQGKT